MTQLNALFVLLGCIALPALALYDYSQSNVIELTEDTWGQLEDSDHAWVVEFFAPWCGHCQEFAPAYEKAAQKLNHMIKIAAVDADAHPDLAAQFGVRGFPSIKFFPGEATHNPYTHKHSKIPQDYNGPRTTKGVVDFALSKQPSHVQLLTPSTQLQNEDSLPVAYFFTNKDTTSPLLKAISTEFKSRIVVAEVRHSEKDLCNKFEVSSFPTILIQKPQEEQIHKFSDDISFPAIEAWLSQYAPEKKAKKAAETQEAGMRDVVSLAAADVEATVKKSKDAWVIVFRSGEEAVPGLGKTAIALQGQANIAVVQCDDDACGALGVKEFPSVHVYVYGRLDKSKFKSVTADEEGFKEAKKLVGDSLPTSNIVVLNDESAEPVLSAALRTKGKSAVLLFSDKVEPSGLFRALSIKYKGVLLFAFASNPSEALRNRFGVKSVPFILALFPDPNGKPKITEDGKEAQEFKGASIEPKKMKGLNYPTLDHFLSQIAAIHGASAQDGKDAEEQHTADDHEAESRFRPAEQPTGPIPELTKDTFGDLCGNAGGLCAIAVLDGHPKSQEERQKQLDVLAEVRKRKSPSPYHFAWLDGGCHINFLLGLDIPATDMPTLVILSPKKLRWAKLVGKYDVAGLSTFVGGVLSNRIPTAPLLSIPELQSDCSQVYNAQAESADQGQEDDILAEILAEEKARKAALEEELRREAEEKKKADGEADKKKGKKQKKGKKGKKQEL